MKHIILAVSYRAEMLEEEMKAQEKKVSGDKDKSPGFLLLGLYCLNRLLAGKSD